MVDPARGAEETFDLNTLGLIRVGGQEWRVCRGKYRSSLSRHDFFVTVGRPDLEARESSRRTTENAFYYGGVATALVGGALLFAHVRASEGSFNPPIAAGGSVLAAGIVSVLVSRMFAGPAVSTDEADGLVVRYNEQLRDHLEGAPASPRVARREGLRLLPVLVTGAVGVVASGRF